MDRAAHRVTTGRALTRTARAPLMELARVTGGFAGSSLNLVAMMKSPVEASENYYPLYDRPADYVADGKFHDIRVKVKTGEYRLTDRAGYIAD